MEGGFRFCSFALGLLLLMEACRVGGQATSANSTLPVGSGTVISASSNHTWTSPNATFMAGFQELRPNSFYFCIWYNQDVIPTLTIVWVANREASVDADATLNFFTNGSVALLHANNNSSVTAWSIPTDAAIATASAQLLENGNLVFMSNNSATVLWQSFDNPTHTLLPGQSLELQGEQLHSWLSTDSDPSAGLFSAFIEAASSVDSTSGKFRIVLSEFTLEYYSFLTNGTYFRFTRMGLSSDGTSIAFTDDNGTDTTANLHPPASISACDQNSSTTPYRRLTLDSDGNLRMYSWRQELLQWVVVWRALFDQCFVYNTCGHNGVCTHNTTLNGANCPLPQPTLDQYCSCPLGYQAVDQLNLFKGCEVMISAADSTSDLCSASHMEVVTNFTYDLNLLVSVIVASLDACQTSCTNDCSCLAVNYNPSERNCSLAGSFLNGTAVTSMDPSKMLFVKVSGSADSGKAFPAWGIVVIVVVGIIAMTVLAVMALHTRPYNPYLGVIGVQRFSYQHLKKITGNFGCLVGKGGFGRVYEGVLLDSNRKSPVRVAVKVLFRDEAHNSEDFITEVETLGSIHHGNVVKLIGLCAENTKSTLLNCYKQVKIRRLLVYEFMEKGSLASCLFRTDNILDWATRVRIMIEAADGLEYLHRFCRNRILHLDIKPDNILLDADYHAKVSDFGLAKVMEGGKTHTLNPGYTVGTHIYMAPECCMFGLAITTKADVYSFGVVILEVVSGKKATYSIEQAQGQGARSFSLLETIPWMDSHDYLQLLDERLGEDFILEELERLLKVALWCLQKDADQRPTMEEVVAMVSGTKDVSHPPLNTMFHLLSSQPMANQVDGTTTDKDHKKQLDPFSASLSFQNVSGR